MLPWVQGNLRLSVHSETFALKPPPLESVCVLGNTGAAGRSSNSNDKCHCFLIRGKRAFKAIKIAA